MQDEIILEGLSSDIREAISSVADGFQEVIVILRVLHDNKDFIDYDCNWGITEIIQLLKDNEITGARISILFNVICKRDYMKMVAILRARQLGDFKCLSKKDLIYAVENNGLGINLNGIIIMVDNSFPTFRKASFRFS